MWRVDVSVLERTEGKAVAHWILERYMGEGQGLEALTRPRPGMVVASMVVTQKCWDCLERKKEDVIVTDSEIQFLTCHQKSMQRAES